MTLAEERELLTIARQAVGVYISRHPGVAHQADDLLSDACFGAVSAASRHDPDGAADRKGFVMRRAHGAIVDGLRHRAPLRRTEYARAEDPTELAKQRTPLPLDLLMEATGWAPTAEGDAASRLERAQDIGAAREKVARLLAVCTPLERVALLAVVATEQRTVDVAKQLGVTESAISAAKTSGLRRIRAFLADPTQSEPVVRQNNRTFRELLTAIPEIAHLSQGVTVDTAKEKIAAALRHEHAPIRRAAQQVNAAFAKLDTALADWDAREAARERVAELERALAEARIALRGGAAKKPTAPKGEHAQARAWAQANSVLCPSNGRVPTAVLEAWRRATRQAA